MVAMNLLICMLLLTQTPTPLPQYRQLMPRHMMYQTERWPWINDIPITATGTANVFDSDGSVEVLDAGEEHEHTAAAIVGLGTSAAFYPVFYEQNWVVGQNETVITQTLNISDSETLNEAWVNIAGIVFEWGEDGTTDGYSGVMGVIGVDWNHKNGFQLLLDSPLGYPAVAEIRYSVTSAVAWTPQESIFISEPLRPHFTWDHIHGAY